MTDQLKKGKKYDRHYGFGPMQRHSKRGSKSGSPHRKTPVTLKPERLGR